MSSIDLVVTAFLMVVLLASIFSQKTRLPYTLALVIVGVVLTTTYISFPFGAGPIRSEIGGGILAIRTAYTQLAAGGVDSAFVGLVVPPLIFEAMTHIRASDMKEALRPALTLATAGVVLATIVGGTVLWKLTGLALFPAFLFSALISPTDTVTVLSMFKNSAVPSRLSALMELEAAFNDATAIVVFSVIAASVSLANIPVLAAAGTFALKFGGGIAVGSLVALLARFLDELMDDRFAKTLLSVFAVYGSYSIAGGFGFSGLIAVSIIGIFFGQYTARREFEPVTRETFRAFWEIVAFVANSIAFLFIGFEINFFSLVASIGLVVVAYVAVTVSRIVAVYPTLSVLDWINHTHTPTSWKNVSILGGMRGALSVALAASVASLPGLSRPEANTILTMALGVAFLSISFQAAMLSRYVRTHFGASRH